MIEASRVMSGLMFVMRRMKRESSIGKGNRSGHVNYIGVPL